MSNFTKLMIKAAAGNAGGGCPEEYWVSSVNAISGSVADDPKGIAVDSECNIYALDIVYNSSTQETISFILKYDPEGSLLWTKQLTTTKDIKLYDIAIDSQDNIYVAGIAKYSVSGSQNLVCLIKLDSSGTIQWKKTYATVGGVEGYAIALDSSGNIFIAGATGYDTSGGNDGLLLKINSSGTLQWTRVYGDSNTNTFQGKIAIDSSGNIIIVATTTYFSQTNIWVVKFNTSGTVLWNRIFRAGGATRGFGVSIDSSDNIYATGDNYIIKLNSSGVTQWKKTSTSGVYVFQGATLNSEEDLISTGYTSVSSTGSEDFLVVKFNSSGSVVFDRLLGTTARDLGFYMSVTVDASDNIIGCGYTELDNASNNDDIATFKLPGDGSGIGTHGSWVYKNASYAVQNATFTEYTNPGGFVLKTPTYTSANLTVSESFITPASETLTAITP